MVLLALQFVVPTADRHFMSSDRTPVDPNLFGMKVELPTIPMRVCESKPAESQVAHTVSFAQEEAPEVKEATGWRSRLAKLSFRPTS